MTGDGVNDAPALKQAEVGIAVANATDVAKAAASLVLTSPGLANVVAAVETSRRIYQRMLTYTLNKIIKTFEIGLLLSVGLMLTGVFVTTPKLILLLLFTNDFVTMSIATDRVAFARTPDRWRVRPLIFTGLVLAFFILILSFGIFFWARDQLQLPLPQLQTLIFVMLVFNGQGTVYLVRERRHFWSSLPSRWLLTSSLLDLLIVSVMATQGILMAPISPGLVGGVLLLILLYLAVVDFLKIKTIQYFRLRVIVARLCIGNLDVILAVEERLVLFLHTGLAGFYSTAWPFPARFEGSPFFLPRPTTPDTAFPTRRCCRPCSSRACSTADRPGQGRPRIHESPSAEVETVVTDQLNPTPERFLDLIHRQQRSRLKIYLGFAAGVPERV